MANPDYGNAPVTPGSVNEAYEKTVSTPVKDDYSSGKKCCRPAVLGNTCIALGVILAIAGIVFGTVIPSTVNSRVNKGVVMCTQADFDKVSYTDSYGDCEDCAPFYYNYYLFNVTNANAFLEKGEKLAVKEVGPYTFRKRTFKSDVKLEGDAVSYKSYNTWTFEPSMSCAGCTDKDVVTSFDAAYMSVMAGAGGESGFLTSFMKGSALAPSDAEVAKKVKTDGKDLLRFFNGLNSLDPVAMKNVQSAFTTTLLTRDASGLATLDMEGFSYNGLLVARTVRQFAIGYPSFLAGIVLGGNYVNTCKKPLGDSKIPFIEQCKNCKGDECLKIAIECEKCKKGEGVVKNNKKTCAQVEAIYAAKYGAKEGKAFADSTCGGCEVLGTCVAPLPGAIEKSGFDWSNEAPPSETQKVSSQQTGCDNKDIIGDYVLYDGVTTIPLFAKLDKKRNPTLLEIGQYKSYANCEKPLANVTCSPVMGGDGTSLKPAGVSTSGLASEASVESRNLYVSPAVQNVTVFNTKEEVEFKGISLIRFRPANDVLHTTEENAVKGTGYPVNGVQNLAFTSGFLAYVSYPMYLYGDKSLTENIDITMLDGTKASQSSMYENGKLKDNFTERLTTYVDVEPTTGRTMHAFKRLQASYALSKSPANSDKPMTDILWPKLKAEVIMPVYWGEETASIPDNKVETFDGVKGIMGTVLPIMIVGIVFGVLLIAAGVFVRLRAKKSASGPIGA